MDTVDLQAGQTQRNFGGNHHFFVPGFSPAEVPRALKMASKVGPRKTSCPGSVAILQHKKSTSENAKNVARTADEHYPILRHDLSFKLELKPHTTKCPC